MAYIIFLNGTSDQFVEAGMLPKRLNDGGEFDWRNNRPKFFNTVNGGIIEYLNSQYG